MRRFNLKKIAIVLGISGVVIWGGSVTFAKMIEKHNIKVNQAIAQQKKEQEEAEAKKPIIGVNEEGKKYTYDAKKVQEKLNNHDYTNDGKKVVFLTFDDGTSKTNTPEVLRILKENNIKATFFLTGSNIENGGETAKDLVRQEFNSGHAIANHSYSHDFKLLYPGRNLDMEAFKADYEKNDKLLKSILGENFTTHVMRCPGGYMSWKNMDPLKDYLNENKIASIDWNALNADAEGPKKNAQQLVDFAIKTAQGKEMVVLLMHDTYGKEETVKALPSIIKYFKDNGYEFRTLV
ncbi:MAG: polysaccharide deacetylase family protein [Clostridiales bacterium]|mgnify:CR=1 FL=1|uniref:polysaccharide deacetylase family protein n=1 Tax=Clostridia TaxID=186801 RepID=UPI0025EA6D8A|nr:polysaccharide deacetylase family protein [Intestinibacter sp.]MDU1201511.1 polysaccharide deacetylase family protein [Clostridiales bacterium]MDY5213251.1 polysaccharide deacetylase family protein [Intestinibacter sp.]